MMTRDVWNCKKKVMTARVFRLFNRYLFARLPIDTRQWKMVEAIDELDSVLGANGVPAIVPEADITRFRKAEEAHEFDVTKRERFPIGSKIHVMTGPFGGFAGQVVSVEGKRMVKAMVEIFGGLVPVDFPWDTVVPE
jgi:transcription antitermination factor NusG